MLPLVMTTALTAAPMVAVARGTGHSYGSGNEKLLPWLLLAGLIYGAFRAYFWIKGTRLYERVERFVPSWNTLGMCLGVAYLGFLVWVVLGMPLYRGR